MAWVQEDLVGLEDHPVSLHISLIASTRPGADHSEWGMNFNKIKGISFTSCMTYYLIGWARVFFYISYMTHNKLSNLIILITVISK